MQVMNVTRRSGLTAEHRKGCQPGYGIPMSRETGETWGTPQDLNTILLYCCGSVTGNDDYHKTSRLGLRTAACSWFLLLEFCGW